MQLRIHNTNFDIVAYNTIAPSANTTWNLGQLARRWFNIHAEIVRCNRIVFDANPTIQFSGSYNDLRDKPAGLGEWTTKFSYENIGPLMYPATPTNLDVVVSDSITPAITSTYNLGQDRLRWKHIFSDDVVCETIWFSQPGSYTTGIDLTAERIIYNEERIDLNSVNCELLKANAPLYALKTVVNPIASDVTTLKTDVAKLKTDYAALLSIVNKLSMAPAANNTTF